jgi:hypothetical protein
MEPFLSSILFLLMKIIANFRMLNYSEEKDMNLNFGNVFNCKLKAINPSNDGSKRLHQRNLE